METHELSPQLRGHVTALYIMATYFKAVYLPNPFTTSREILCRPFTEKHLLSNKQRSVGMATAVDLTEWEKDPRLFLFTSLTAGSSHIITATSRLETILKANKLPFQAVDTATDEKARKLWGRRAGKKKLPGLVKEGYVIADLEEVEDWNEFGELKENIGPLPPAGASVNTVQTTLGSLRMHDAGSLAASSTNKPAPAAVKAPTPGVDASKIKPLASAAPEATPTPAPIPASAPTDTPPTSSLVAADEATKPETSNPSVAQKTQSICTAEDTAALASKAEPAEESAVTEAPSQDSAEVPATDASSTEQKHRGSSLSQASTEEIKVIEKSTAIPEAEEEESTEEPEVKAKETIAAKESTEEPEVKAKETAAEEASADKPEIEAKETAEAEKIPSQESAAADEAEVSVQD